MLGLAEANFVTQLRKTWQADAKGFVAPAKAGVQKHAHKKIKHFWIPACAGMTEKTLLREFASAC